MQKLGTTQMFEEDGSVIVTSVLKVLYHKVLKKLDGNDKKKKVLVAVINHGKKLNKPMIGIQKQYDLQGFHFSLKTAEICDEDMEKLEDGHIIDADFFSDTTFIDVGGVTKGKGTEGVMKRHGFAGQSASHGASLSHRSPGSIGMQNQERVNKGQKLPGRMGNEYKTHKNLKILKIDSVNNLIYVRGTVVGPKKSFVFIRKSKKNQFVKK